MDQRQYRRGFTLIETLVVLLISAGLIVTMALLYRTVAHAALALEGDDKDWKTHILLRQQLRYSFTLPDPGQRTLAGETTRLSFLTWYGRINQFDGRPVIANYHYDPAKRMLYYRELDLPAWWTADQSAIDLPALLRSVEQETPIVLLQGVGSLEMRYLPGGKLPENPLDGLTAWQAPSTPAALFLGYSRANRDTGLWIAIRGSRA
jgi:prepilin-type N-terminal cleavage/methylation domain-containing protein